ncbi:MAG: M42 family metallopeptidase [Anaerolineae bacterium]
MSATIELEHIKDFLLKLLNTPSPTGNTDAAIKLVAAEFAELGLQPRRTVKGGLLAVLPGKTTLPPRAITAHVDTLGGMVKEIKKDGRLLISSLGGYYPGSIAGEYCTIETTAGQTFSGTVLLEKQSVHIFGMTDVHDTAKKLSTLEVRVDARTRSKEETAALGIQVGDFISWDPRAQITSTGFIKSRHLDDKAGVAAMLAAARALTRQNLSAARTTYLHVSAYEEVGHGGAAGIPAKAEELLVIDMGAVGEGQAGDEFGVSICVKDNSGPYDLQLRRQLVALAQAEEIPYNLDIYVNYGSDGSAALRAGANMRVGLIGPGVDSSHAYERTHHDSILNTARLIAAYLQSE